MSTAMVSLGIGTGFERCYHVLKRLGATPLGRPRLLGAKIGAVVVVELLQFAILVPVAYAARLEPDRPELAPRRARRRASARSPSPASGCCSPDCCAARSTSPRRTACTSCCCCSAGWSSRSASCPSGLRAVAQALPSRGARRRAARGARRRRRSAPARRGWCCARWAVAMPIAAAASFRGTDRRPAAVTSRRCDPRRRSMRVRRTPVPAGVRRRRGDLVVGELAVGDAVATRLDPVGACRWPPPSQFVLEALEPHEDDDRPQVHRSAELHDRPGELLVADDATGPTPAPGCRRPVHRPSANVSQPAGHGGHDRHQEQVHHLARHADLQLGERPADRHPHEQGGDHQDEVQRVVQRRVTAEWLTIVGDVGDHHDDVEDQTWRRPGKHSHFSTR